jgi:serine/threonine protein phosphatase PrpC
MVNDETIADILAQPTERVQDVADALVDAANDAGGLDNVTALVVRTSE